MAADSSTMKTNPTARIVYIHTVTVTVSTTQCFS